MKPQVDEKVEVLVSTMNETGFENTLNNLRLTENDNIIIINQVPDKKCSQQDCIMGNTIFCSFQERGLSRSRNRALSKSSGDICVITDDDMYYEPDYKEIIRKAYKKYSSADIIAFYVADEDPSHHRKILRKGRVGFLKSCKLSSWQITFRRDSVLKKHIWFDENFGTGSGKYRSGEENIFLADCLRCGLKIYYQPTKIATLRISESTWDKSPSIGRYEDMGAVFRRMTPRFYAFMIVQFALRKRKTYRGCMHFYDVLISMFRGAHNYRPEIGDLK